ncbi:ketopantoate reductase family protein [Paraburkholderia sp. GAS348]|uniref:ketopantoate reductase family protein n=1 Tax=Paraburkholderia sp. GAS348 TaxID=3035132 RepID=UPI003D1F24B0
MKILVLGAGAIGAYYGARLIQAGADVTFAVRPKRKRSIEASGLRVKSVLGDFQSDVSLVDSSNIPGKYDLVVLSCKTYDLEQAIEAIAPTVHAGAAVLPFLNGRSAYDLLDRQFGRDKIIGGVAYIATMMSDDGAIEHLGDTDTVIVGARSPGMQDLVQRFHGVLSQSPGRRSISPNVDQALWDKWAMISASALMCCLIRGTVGEIMATREGAALMSQAIHECTEVARRSGFELSREVIDQIRGRLLDRESRWAPSMMRDIEAGLHKLEADAIVGDMAARAHALDIPAVLTSAAYANLQVYMARKASGRTASR